MKTKSRVFACGLEREPKSFVLLLGEWVGSWWKANWYK
jgi:hypothetical protein